METGKIYRDAVCGRTIRHKYYSWRTDEQFNDHYEIKRDDVSESYQKRNIHCDADR